MQNPLQQSDLLDQVQSAIYTQQYGKKELIDGVQIVEITNFLGEDSDFCEVMRIDEQHEIAAFPGFRIRQISRTRMFPNTVKGWHLHLKQNELWYVLPEYQLFVGLWDLRKNSLTAGKAMRVVLGGGKSQLLHIPQGVAHGVANHSTANANLFYFVDQQFNKEDPDERRIHWDALGAEFWAPQRD